VSSTTTSNSTSAIHRARGERLLHDGWQVKAVSGPAAANVEGRAITASVPGSVHTDLMAAGLIVDPYLDDNERLLAWVGACDWRYCTSFEWSENDGAGSEHTDLVFEGIDTVARVELNGELVAETRNMHRTYRFDVRSMLREGTNELTVTFASPVKYADLASVEQGYRPHVNHHPYNSIRKMACNFGWDWGPDVPTVGLWRPVTLHSWTSARLGPVRPIATVEGSDGHSRGTVEVNVDLVGSAPGAGRLLVTVGEAQASLDLEQGQTTATVEVVLDDVERWWPRGHGEQPLYQVAVELELDGIIVDAWQGRVGFRTVRIDHTPDEHGTPFAFIVNDRPVFIKGANWIPDDAFVHRVDRSRYAARIAQAEQANINLLRVWGGGIYEADDFYELCDERGILTWQDFLFACAAYSEDEPMRSEVEAEVRDNVTRLVQHPSLVLWNGNNENIWGYQEWGWENRLGDKSWGLGYYLELLPDIVAELDPERPYTPGSPFSPEHSDDGEDQHHPNDPAHGSTHLWELWNRQDYPHYRDSDPRFVGEFGWQGPPTWSTMTRSISDRPLTPESPGMLVHQKAMDGNVKLIDGLIAHLPLPDDMADWHWAMSLNQATAVQVGIEHFRSLSPVCMGAIVWQLNDCWPVTSWAMVDGDGRPKPLLYSVKHAYADRLVTVQPRDRGLVVALVNDSGEAWSGDLVIERLSYDGRPLGTVSMAMDLSARETGTVEVPQGLGTPDDPARELLVATLGGRRALWFFTEYRDSALEAEQLRTTVSRTGSGYEVTVTATNLVRDIALLVDKLDADARVDDQLVTLLPGESVKFSVASGSDLDEAALVSPDVLRSSNQLMIVRPAR